MKELELTLRLRNNRLKERREALGMSQLEFAKIIGIHLGTYSALETMHKSPRSKNGCWNESALKLARFHCVEPEELFPTTVLAVEKPVLIRRLNGDDFYPLLSEHHQRLFEGPDAAFERVELRDQIRRALATISPRDAKVLRLRFGLDDGMERDLVETGATLGVTYERARQLIQRGLRKLRDPRRCQGMREFVQSAEPERGNGET